MEEIVKLDVRISKDLKDRFRSVCDAESVNGSALIRKWIEEYVNAKERPPISMDLLDIVWKLSKSDDIKTSCVSAADRLGYDGAWQELRTDILDMLIERAKSSSAYAEVDGVRYGRALINNQDVYFSLSDTEGSWSTSPPEWLNRVEI